MAKEPDYYKVMERTIRYYSSKYDPNGVLDVKEEPEEHQLTIVPEKKSRKKNFITSMFI